MDRKILVTTDGSDRGRTAVAYAAELARSMNAELTIAVINLAQGGLRGPVLYEFTDDEAEQILLVAAAQARRAGVVDVHETIIESRDAAADVIEYADEQGIDHIITGTADRRGLSRFLFGSTAGDLASRAHCSVTVAR
jgi:nucleotide-binding universal stress UspA family protein